MKVTAKSDVGRVRDENQDSYAVLSLSDRATAVIVCDGMGGANGGSIASSTAVKVISNSITHSFRENMSARSIKAMLESAVIAANISVFDAAKSKDELSGMGTTVVAAVVADSVAYIAHAGDSRAYVVHEKSELEQITKDHSIVQHMIENGQLTADEARVHPKRNVITRALGVGESIDIDYNEIDLNDDDMLLVCTDGLTNYVDCVDILNIVNNTEFDAMAESLVNRANINGGGDNITVVVVAE
ncbi:MAG: Stp1/IreP family PP2C-type Ser/Thr phosphatase [Clostridia bacterium]|nr:Stp1/IreP family PP2C-type Ser/Thr phosphatase [Clostridia bacterium]